MPNSGAFRSLHCLIYKVLIPLRLVRNIRYSNTLAKLCQALFRLFSKSFSYSFRSPEPLESFAILPHSSALVKHFFQLFQSFFRCPACSAGLAQKAWLSYHTSLSLSSPFFIFLETFFVAPSKRLSVSDSLHNIPNPPRFVNTFFQIFSSFFSSLLLLTKTRAVI